MSSIHVSALISLEFHGVCLCTMYINKDIYWTHGKEKQEDESEVAAVPWETPALFF